jgi:hypothetical protein
MMTTYRQLTIGYTAELRIQKVLPKFMAAAPVAVRVAHSKVIVICGARD